jgi:hypothetical protein
MVRVLVAAASLLVSFPALAQDETPPAAEATPVQVAPAPAYGSVRSEPMNVKVNPFIGFMLGGAKPFGTFGDGFNFGPEFTFRAGAEILIGPGISVAPDGELRFGRFGSADALDAGGISGVLFFGFLFGGRFGFEIAELVTPYFDLHLGYFHGQATGDACSVAGADCGTDKFGMEFGFGAEFWLTPTVGLGPFMKFNFVFTDNASSNWFAFGPSLTLRL